MRPVSARFLRTVRGSHHAVFEARVVTAGKTGVDPSGTVVPILGGDVDFDGAAQVRATLELTTDGNSMWPSRAADLLAPYGNEVFVRRGIAYGDGVIEWVSLGYFRIYTPEQDRAPDGPIRVSARDRMSGIVDGRLVAPRQFSASATYGAVLASLVGEVYPWATIEWDDSTDTRPIGRQIIAEEDRYQVCDDLVRSVGKRWWWDHRGILVVRTPPSPSFPVWEVNHGEGGVLVAMSRRLTREGVYNAVVAVGEGADTAVPARGVAVDLNAASPTYWHGPFGKVPRFFSSPFLTTNAQAQNAAVSMLRDQLGLPYAVDFTSVPNPALEPYDPIRITYPGRSEVHVIDRMTVPLTAEAPLTGSTREKTTVLIGGG